MTTLAKYYLYLNNLLTVPADDDGQGLAEYGLIVALIAVACIVAIGALGDNIADFLQQAADGFGGGTDQATSTQ